ncbi:MAG: methyltransferase domain-containing protein [Chloroflexi bacterium]|nr:methyltransferase domain-containing protein [Chloroflexota bacterium]
MNEQLEFFRQFVSNFRETGAVLPTSSFAAQALSRQCAQWRGPKRVLEAGAGTGAITTEIIKHLRPDDQFVACEINPTLAAYLRKRFASETAFHSVADQCTVYEGSILDLPTDEKFDFIISAIPFNNCPPDFVAAVFAHYQALLKPGGVLSYIEYIGGRTLKQTFAANATNKRLIEILAQQRDRYEFQRDVVLRNVPPAWVHHLRFAETPNAVTANVASLTNRDRLALGNWGVDTDALPFVAALAGAAILLHKRFPNSKIWRVPIIAASLIALFLRDPARQIVNNPTVVYAASDGTVLNVEKLRDERFGEQEWLRIVVFLSILDVHVNRAPIAGEVTAIIQENGGFAVANTHAAQ